MEAPVVSRKTISEVASIFNIPEGSVEHALATCGLTRDQQVDAAWKELECEVVSGSVGASDPIPVDGQEVVASADHGDTCAVPGSDCYCDVLCTCSTKLHEELFFDHMTAMGRRMAFYSKVWKNGRFTIPLREAQWYSQHIDKAVEICGKQVFPGTSGLLTVDAVAALVSESRCEGKQKCATVHCTFACQSIHPTPDRRWSCGIPAVQKINAPFAHQPIRQAHDRHHRCVGVRALKHFHVSLRTANLFTKHQTDIAWQNAKSDASKSVL